MKLVVIIPALNEEKTIGKVISEIPKIDSLTQEVIVVDDGSKDKTVEVARKHGAIVLKHQGNKGVGKAFRTGIEEALKRGADVIVNMDADGQFNPTDIKKLVAKILSGYDFVTCTRFGNLKMTGKMPAVKNFGNVLFSALISRLINKKFTDTQCGFRAYSREAALRLTVYGDYTYTQEVFIDLAHKGMRMTEIPCQVLAKRENGKSRVMQKGIIHYIFRSLKIVIRSYRDYRPLTFFGLPGLVLLSLGVCLGIGVLVFWLMTFTTTPARTYITLTVFTSTAGLILITIALIADMFNRIRKNEEEILYRMRKLEFGK